MSADNVTPIRPGSVDSRGEQIELAYMLMVQAVRAAILLIIEDEQPGLAGDVLRLALDRFDGLMETRPAPERIE